MSGNYLDLIMSSGRHNESISCEMPEAEILYQISFFLLYLFSDKLRMVCNQHNIQKLSKSWPL